MVSVTESVIYVWFDRSTIEYRDLFMRLYVAYNAWYRKVTGKDNDYEAIQILKERFVIWDDYLQGRSLDALRQVLIRIVIQTANTPLKSELGGWSGRVNDSDDWRGLIHFWYEVRCGLFHGSSYAVEHTTEVQLAYESLYIFMAEVVSRMKYTFRTTDRVRLDELAVLSGLDGIRQEMYVTEKARLHQKFIQSPKLWNVDMVRVRKE